MASIRFLVSFCCLMSLSPVDRAQDLHLNKLSDCDGLVTIEIALEQPVSHSCRQPRDRIEARLMSGFQWTPEVHACLLAEPPTARLAGFSCIDHGLLGGRELACFRLMDAGTLRDYQQRYDSVYRTPVFNYKNVAANCPASNGDASDAQASLFPQLLSPIAKARFGFVLGLGKSRKPQSRAYHGFADLDPDLGPLGSALEIFDVTSVGAYHEDDKPHTTDLGQWKFDIDDMPRESQRDFARPFQQLSGERIEVRMRAISIASAHSTETSVEDRKDNLNDWQHTLGAYLKKKGFRRLTAREMADTPFRDEDAMRDMIASKMPYGIRDHAKRLFGPRLVFLVDQKEDDCNRVAEVIVYEPEDGVKSDFGAMGLSVFSIGSCQAEGRRPEEMLDRIIQEETQILEDEVQKQ